MAGAVAAAGASRAGDGRNSGVAQDAAMDPFCPGIFLAVNMAPNTALLRARGNLRTWDVYVEQHQPTHPESNNTEKLPSPLSLSRLARTI